VKFWTQYPEGVTWRGNACQQPGQRLANKEGWRVAIKEDVLLVDAAAFTDSEDLRDLIAKGTERGYVTAEELVGKIDELELSDQQVKELRSHLTEQGVEVIAPGAGTAAGEQNGKVDDTALHAGAAEPAKKPELDLTVEPSLDSLRLY